MQAVPAKSMALPQAMSLKATTVAFSNSNITPKTPRKRNHIQHLTRPHTKNPSYHDQDSNLNCIYQTH